jgi:hypothetical protein
VNIARWFSYTRFLERELVRARRKHEREREQWNEERQRLENVVFLSHGVNAPNPQHLRTRSETTRRSVPVAVGPLGHFGVAARNAALEEERQRQIDEESRRVPTPAPASLPAETQDRIRKAAEDTGLPLRESDVA